MKKLLSVLLLVSALLLVVGCGEEKESNKGGSSTGGNNNNSSSATLAKTYDADEALTNYSNNVKNGFADYAGKKIQVNGLTADEDGKMFTTNPEKFLFISFHCDNYDSLNVTPSSKYNVTGVVESGTTESLVRLSSCSLS